VKILESQITSKKFDECVNPVKVIGADRDTIASMFGSHDWDFDSGKPFGPLRMQKMQCGRLFGHYEQRLKHIQINRD
jgi:hypothetical protein